MESEDMGSENLDVTIDLVWKPIPEQAAGSTGNKKRRRMSASCDGIVTNCDDMDNGMDMPEAPEHGMTLAKVKAKSSTLRECSKYFESCMSERWAHSKSSSSQVEFRLEVQTEVKYYIDCFSRMRFLYKPIASVTDCIELLKVASQIGFQNVVEIGVKYLAAAPWSQNEESLIRDFCNSAYLVKCDSIGDLNARLDDFPSATEGKQEGLSTYAMNLLHRYLRDAKSHVSYDEYCREVVIFDPHADCCKKFAAAFRLIVSRTESGDVRENLLEQAIALVTQESEKILAQLPWSDVSFDTIGFMNKVSMFCWFFEVARESNAAQTIVERLVDDEKTLFAFYECIREVELDSILSSVTKWAQMMYNIFEDVLEGKLFLKTSQRVTLFRVGTWLVLNDYLGYGGDHALEFVAKFVTTLPPQEQSEGYWRLED